MYYTYILTCADNTLYCGITTDIKRRIEEHNTDNKKGAKYTRTRRPVKMVYFAEFPDRIRACKEEARIKKMTRPQKIKLIES